MPSKPLIILTLLLCAGLLLPGVALAQQGIIAASGPLIDECFATFTEEPSQYPGVRVKFVVSKEGRPTLIMASEAENPNLTKCVLDVVAALKFPPAPREVLMNYNFAFKQEAPGDDVNPYERDYIRQVVHENAKRIETCYTVEMQKVPGLRGNVMTKFYISYDGTVLLSSIENSTLNNLDVERCILEEVLEFRFPAPPQIITVFYPFHFMTKGKGDE